MLLFSCVFHGALVSDGNECSCGLPLKTRRRLANVPPAAGVQHRGRLSPPIPTGRNYGGESTMSYFTQMAGLAYHNFTFGGRRHGDGHRDHSRQSRAKETEKLG